MNASSRFDILIHAQPWQVAALGAEAIVEPVAGEMGATGLTLPARTADSVDAIALDAGGDISGIRLAAGALFQPDPDIYASTRLRPAVSPTLKTRSPIGRIVQIAHERRLLVRLRLGALANAAVAGKYPDAACGNALSLTSASRLCPSNPDVVEWVRCQILDLVRQFEPDGIEIDDFTWPSWFEPIAGRAVWPIAPGPVESALLAICFCPSCRQRAVQAGIEAGMALRSTQVHLIRWLKGESPRGGTIDDLLAQDNVVARYVACQKSTLLSAVGVWSQAAQITWRLTDEETSVPWNPSANELAGAVTGRILTAAPEARTIEPTAGLTEALGLAASGGRNAAEPTSAGGAGFDASRWEFAVDATSPAFGAGPVLVRHVGDLARRGCGAIVLENGLNVSPTRQPFVRQAIRSARRERL